MRKKTKKEKRVFAAEYEKIHGKGSYKEHEKINRVMTGFNTGTRTMRSKKDYNRQAAKAEVRDMASYY